MTAAKWGEVESGLVVQSMAHLSLELPFFSWNCYFVFQKWPFISQKKPIVFLEVFQKCLVFIYCTCLFPRMLFFQLIVFFILPRAQADNIFLALVSFPLETVYWPTYVALHLACVYVQAINRQMGPMSENPGTKINELKSLI